MKTRLITGLALTGVVVLASCSQDRSPVASVPTEASYIKAPTCSFSTMNNDAKAYFASPKDLVFAAIDAMQAAYKLGGASGATSAGFAVLARLGAAADEGTVSVKGTPAQAAAVANDVLLCMDATYTGYVNSAAFTANLTLALGPEGLFAIRNAASSAAATSRLLVGGYPAFGAEPSTGNWPFTGDVVVYGWKLSYTSFANELPGGTVSDLRTLPSGLTFTPKLKAGVCVLTDPNARILHKHALDPAVILPPTTAMSFCPVETSAPAPSSTYAFASRLASWLAPQTLQAASMPAVAGGGGAGLIGGLSEIGPVSYDPVLKFTVPPTNTSVSTPAPQFPGPVTVTALTAKTNPLYGVLITLTVVGNNGGYNISGDTARTDITGTAKFPLLKIDKAGGYVMTATSEVGGTAQVNFQINGQ